MKFAVGYQLPEEGEEALCKNNFYYGWLIF